MPELQALLEAVQQNNQSLEEIEGELTDLRVEIGNLPKKYIGRDEAHEKAERVRNIAAFVVVTLVTMGLVVLGLVLYFRSEIKEESLVRCRNNRNAIKELVMTAVADRQPLPTATPEAIAAIERTNQESVRPLRERLLSLDGAQPEKC